MGNIPTAILLEHLGQRSGASLRDELADRALAYTNICARLWLECGDMPGKMEGALQHACNYLGVTFRQAVDAMEEVIAYEEGDDTDAK